MLPSGSLKYVVGGYWTNRRRDSLLALASRGRYT